MREKLRGDLGWVNQGFELKNIGNEMRLGEKMGGDGKK